MILEQLPLLVYSCEGSCVLSDNLLDKQLDDYESTRYTTGTSCVEMRGGNSLCINYVCGVYFCILPNSNEFHQESDSPSGVTVLGSFTLTFHGVDPLPGVHG